MTREKKRVAAKEGWYSIESADPHLIGGRCQQCGTYSFPAETVYCRNPACDSDTIEQVALSRTGKVWSYTNACYQPPEPYIAVTDPYQPFALVAVELEAEKMIILGAMSQDVTVDELIIGDKVELIIETLAESDSEESLIWHWRRVEQ